ncbi:MAG: hypothetical protein MUF00_17570 [Gemmatimonadaceae bacterium]|jgi:serine/threonine protein kinase|nr:hypothetical protein [Gemmatimonadaceae bacterium]
MTDRPETAANADPSTGPAAAGPRIGAYRLIRELGRGGMGVVYEAESEPDGRRVALKLLADRLQEEEARARFLREGRLAAGLMHPNAVYVHDPAVEGYSESSVHGEGDHAASYYRSPTCSARCAFARRSFQQPHSALTFAHTHHAVLQ